jgi:hypothetical protein
MNPELARDIVVVVILTSFVWLGFHDILGGEFRTGIAAWCLAIANYLLLL